MAHIKQNKTSYRPIDIFKSTKTQLHVVLNLRPLPELDRKRTISTVNKITRTIAHIILDFKKSTSTSDIRLGL